MPLDQVDIDKYDAHSLQLKEEKEMSFLDHIEELRWHILRSLGVVILLTIIIFLAKDFVFKQILYAQRNPDFITYRVMCKVAAALHIDDLCIHPIAFDVIAPDLGEMFFAHMQISFVLGLIIAFPYIFWEFWRFISPGLHLKERKAARGIIFICTSLFFLGVAFGYYIIAPFAISFLAGYEVPDTRALPTLSSYLSYMIMFTMPIGLVFELPVLIYFLARIGLITASFMREYRKHAIIIILIVAGIITPSPDIVSQLLVGIPLYTLYEVSIFVAERVEKRKAKEEAEEANN